MPFSVEEPWYPVVVQQRAFVPIEEFNEMKDRLHVLQVENSEVTDLLHKAQFDNRRLEEKAHFAIKELETKQKDFNDRAHYCYKVKLNEEAVVSKCKDLQSSLRDADKSILLWQKKWKESSAHQKEMEKKHELEIEKWKKKLRNRDQELQLVQAKQKECSEDLEKNEKPLEEARAEIGELKIRAKVKKPRSEAVHGNVDEEVFYKHIDALTEALAQRDDLIRGLVERPKHPDTVALLEEVKIQSSKLKDLKIQD